MENQICVKACCTLYSTNLVSWCFEPIQPLRITSGLKTNFSPSLSYSTHKPPLTLTTIILQKFIKPYISHYVEFGLPLSLADMHNTTHKKAFV